MKKKSHNKDNPIERLQVIRELITQRVVKLMEVYLKELVREKIVEGIKAKQNGKKSL